MKWFCVLSLGWRILDGSESDNMVSQIRILMHLPHVKFSCRLLEHYKVQELETSLSLSTFPELIQEMCSFSEYILRLFMSVSKCLYVWQTLV